MNTAQEILEKKAFNAPFGAPNLPELPSWKSVKSGIGDMVHSVSEGLKGVPVGAPGIVGAAPSMQPSAGMTPMEGVKIVGRHIADKMPAMAGEGSPGRGKPPVLTQEGPGEQPVPEEPTPVNQWDDAALDAEFKRRHATHFDPHSKMDRGKMRIMREKLGIGNPAPAPAPNPQTDEDWNKLFMEHNRTSFDPHSRDDRAKMQALRQQYGH